MMKINTFKKICRMSQSKLHDYVANSLSSNGYKVVNDKKFVYAKGELPILLVAHLDTVHKSLPSLIITDGNKMSSPQGIGGDDRCGVFIILNLISKLKCSVLFCEDEEIGGKGAEAFITSPILKDVKKSNLNYIIEFDRRGERDAVFYDCDNDEFIEFIESTKFFKEAWGTFSDISIIAPVLDVSAVNLSCGYFNAHTISEYVDISAMYKIIEESEKLINTKVEAPFEYIERKSYYRRYGGYGSLYDYGYDYGWGYDDYYYDDDDYVPKSCTYTIVFERNDEIYESDVEAHSEDEAIGKFLRLYDDMCYAEIIDIYKDYTSELKESSDKHVLEIIK